MITSISNYGAGASWLRIGSKLFVNFCVRNINISQKLALEVPDNNFSQFFVSYRSGLSIGKLHIMDFRYRKLRTSIFKCPDLEKYAVRDKINC